ncbi:MAG TPA: hypothetical protein VEU30_02100 [Thermoanaerobaculia bacterium]|nr:hypothetical protein [Thermoanaerobaculia bacterium]
MGRWAARIMGLLLLLVFALVMTQLHKQLTALQKQQEQSQPAR